MKKIAVKRYDYLIDDLNDAVYTVSIKDFVFTSLNKTAEQLTGYSKDELLNKPITVVVPKEYLPLVKKKVSLKKLKNTSTIYEIEIIRKEGTKIPVEISSKVILEDGKAVEILGIARDISERKLIEKQRDVFISLITHEIKNPLTAIKLHVELLEKNFKKDFQVLHKIEIITRQIRSMETLMNDFLSVTQIQQGQFKLNKEKFDLDQLVEEIIESLQNSSGHKLYKKGKINKFVYADKNRIHQVIINLLTNAIKYSPQSKKINILLSTTQEEIKIGIQDFGVGIPKNEQKHIFDIFSRTHFALKSNIKGHGLGLYFSSQIIKYHKGKIWAESEPGKGSTFFFTLPNKD